MDGSAYNYGTTDGRAIATFLLVVVAAILTVGGIVGWVARGLFA